MRSRILSSLTFSLCIVCTSNVSAYELATHGSITNHAFGRSALSGDYLVNGLGIIDSVDLFGLSYYDVSESGVSIRNRDNFENSIIETDLKLASESLTLKGWLMRGAIREDDYQKKSIPCKTNPPNPPNGEALDRPINHFYDPINNQSLGFGAEKAFDWALGTANALTDGNAAEADRDNHYSVFDAREAMYRALTERNKAGSKAIGVGGSTPSNAADKEALRKAYWATTFRALGDVVHLIQDMAQPQHTRSDPHLTECPDIVQALLGGKSLYEDYVDKRATGSLFEVKGGVKITLPPLVYTDAVNPYPIPQFNDYVSYFTTRHLESGIDDGSVLSRRGLADYSNRSFFTVRTNFNPSSPRYALPTNNFPAYGTKIETTDWTGMPLPGDGVTLLTHQVTDSLDVNQTRPAVPLTTFSVWDSWLQDRGFFKRYSLNRFNYDAMADLLIPRAVAYSAGLIDYFFRGRMEISLPNDGVYAILDHAVEKNLGDGFRKIKLKLYNSTPAINDGQNDYPQDMTGGTLRAVVKFQRNGCYQPDLLGEPGLTSCDIDAYRGPEEIVISNALTVQGAMATLPELAQEFVFDFSTTPIPVNAVNVSLQVVYRGTLGSETDAVVVATMDISEPTFFSYVSRGSYFNHFHFGGGNILGTANATGRGSRFAVLIENGPLTWYFRNDNQTNWSSSVSVEIFQPTANWHQYNPETGQYDIRYLNYDPGAYVIYGFVGHVNFIFGYDPDAPDLSNLTPYPLQLYF